MKNTFIATAVLLGFATTSFVGLVKPPPIDPSDDIEYYVNSGKTKIESIECYDFDNLMVKVKLIPEMKKYEYLRLYVRRHIPSGARDKEIYRDFSELELSRATKGEVAEFYIFKTGESNSCFSNNVPKDPLRRGRMQSTSQKGELEGSYLQAEIKGMFKTGATKEYYDSGCSCYRKKPVWGKEEIYLSQKLPLKNRVKQSPIKMISSGNAGPAVQGTGSCYPDK